VSFTGPGRAECRWRASGRWWTAVQEVDGGGDVAADVGHLQVSGVAGTEASAQPSEVVPDRVAVQHRVFFLSAMGCDDPGCPAFEFYGPLVAVGSMPPATRMARRWSRVLLDTSSSRTSWVTALAPTAPSGRPGRRDTGRSEVARGGRGCKLAAALRRRRRSGLCPGMVSRAGIHAG